jgi:hypothetical protein
MRTHVVEEFPQTYDTRVQMQTKQALRVTPNPFVVLGLKFLFSLLLVPALLICAGADISTGGNPVVGSITISPAQLATATVGTAYTASINAQGGAAPYQFVLVHGAIPPGLSLNTTTGRVSGTPTTAGTYSFRLNVTDLPHTNRGEVTVNMVVSTTTAPAPVTVSVSPTSASVASAGRQQFSASVGNTSNTSVTWTASSGTISSSGMFTAPTVTANTTASVTATSVADPTKHAQVTITVGTVATAPVSISVSPTSSALISGGSQQFTAAVTNTSNTAVTWTTTGGTIGSGGMFTAPNVANSAAMTVTATSVADPTKSAHSTVTVNPPATVSVSVSPIQALVASAGSQQFTATVQNATNTSVTWSANTGSISANGLFVAPAVTSSVTAIVTAQSVANPTKSAQATVTVSANSTPPPPPPPPPPPLGADNTYCGSGDTANFGGTDTVATLPQACINTALANTPSPGKIIPVAAGGGVQNAINSAACGDTIELQAGASFTGTFSLPNKNCDGQHWVTIRTSAPNTALPPEGTRLTPCYAGVASLPDRPAYYCPSPANVMPMILAGGNQAFITQAGAGYYRLIGLEITHPAGMQVGQPDTLVALTNGTQLPHHVIVDRCWIHGLPTTFLKRGIKLDGSYLAVIDSTITDVHAVGTATQGMLSGTGTGPLKIVNNFVEGGDSAVGFGGQGNPFGDPADIEIRRNHLFKPWSWQNGSATYMGYPFGAKVAFESKNSDRVLLEGNIMEHTWGDIPGGPVQGGDGSIAWIGPKNQGSGCPTCDVSDITFRYNLIRHAGGGPYIFDAPSDTGAIAMQAMRYSIHDNLLDDISSTYSRAGSGDGILHRFLGTTIFAPPRDIMVFHNTGISNGIAFLSLTANNVRIMNFNFMNNLEIGGMYGVTGCSSLFGTAALSTCAPGYAFAGNVIVGGKGNLTGGAFKPATASAVGFANYNNGNGGDYRLCIGPGNPVASCTAASPYINAGTDGRDIGADLTTLNSLISGVN